jgi:transposase
MDHSHRVIFKQAITRDAFFEQLSSLFPNSHTFAFEACGGCHYVGQKLQELGHKVMAIKPKDVKPYAKSRQKNDLNDAVAICKAALDPEIKNVQLKSKEQQETAYLHKARQNTIIQRIQRSNSLMTSLQEFGYIVGCGKAKFAKECESHILLAFKCHAITQDIFDEMLQDCQEIAQLMLREKRLDLLIKARNKASEKAQLLESIPGIGPINASILSNKPMESYESSKDFAASLGLVPKQHTTGGCIKLGSITKQGDRYARTMLIQAGRSLMMRSFKGDVPSDKLYQFIERLKRSGKGYNVMCVAVANKLARIAYACAVKNAPYRAS